MDPEPQQEQLEIVVLPAKVYGANDSVFPRWRFVVALVNLTKNDWTLKEYRVTRWLGEEENACREVLHCGNENLLGGAPQLSPCSQCSIYIQDRFADENLPTQVSFTAYLQDKDGKSITKSVEVPIMPKATEYVDFPLRGKWFTGNARPDLHSIGRAFAFDFFAEEDVHIHEGPSGKKVPLSECASFDQPLYSPNDGTVVLAVDDQLDFVCTPGEATFGKGLPDGQPLAAYFGNYAAIQRDDGLCMLMVHLRQGSLLVQRGQQVAEGQLIARIGNSGNTSGPHLHIEALDGVPDFNLFNSSNFAQSGVPFGFRSVRTEDGKKQNNVVPEIRQIMERAFQ